MYEYSSCSQDPYPTPGHAVGLSFAVDPLHVGGKLPKSLVNIFKEYSEDLDLPYPTNARAATLQPWIDEGVLLLNRVLTVAARQAHSHARLGWEQVTEAAVRQVARNEHFAAILWGKPAQQLAPLIGEQRCVMSPTHHHFPPTADSSAPGRLVKSMRFCSARAGNPLTGTCLITKPGALTVPRNLSEGMVVVDDGGHSKTPAHAPHWTPVG